jgi:hypothetical protein
MNQIKIRPVGMAHRVDMKLRLRAARYWWLKQQLQSEPYEIASEIWGQLWWGEYR